MHMFHYKQFEMFLLILKTRNNNIVKKIKKVKFFSQVYLKQEIKPQKWNSTQALVIRKMF